MLHFFSAKTTFHWCWFLITAHILGKKDKWSDFDIVGLFNLPYSVPFIKNGDEYFILVPANLYILHSSLGLSPGPTWVFPWTYYSMTPLGPLGSHPTGKDSVC